MPVEKLTATYRLCSRHFEESQFMNAKRDKLIWSAIPTLFSAPKPSSTKRRRKIPRSRAILSVISSKKTREKVSSSTDTAEEISEDECSQRSGTANTTHNNGQFRFSRLELCLSYMKMQLRNSRLKKGFQML